MFFGSLMFLCMFFKMFFYKSVKACLNVFYLQISFFNIYVPQLNSQFQFLLFSVCQSINSYDSFSHA